ncbi:hypothetical protein MSMEG_5289 [Mycolicibacterium smegmatis MC2 155]|uniref:Uncharacterized protein n=1 Tax=Mycolicibacterium smegmatis (strain ATCC 700084 / mc(2)155) TaxID=246196 RepID=A0R2Z7_MYCS2|nr:hypothetical protein MSMEG_5289 [Mycolicibacterium smegmatis MC2 155]
MRLVVVPGPTHQNRRCQQPFLLVRPNVSRRRAHMSSKLVDRHAARQTASPISLRAPRVHTPIPLPPCATI